MNSSKNILFLVGIMTLVSACAPFPPMRSSAPGPTPVPAPPTITSEEQRQLDESRERLRLQEERARYGYGNSPGYGTTPGVKPKYPTAAVVPGKPGFVFNPFTHNIVDVKGIASGKLCRDPEDPDASHKFRVP